MSSDGTGIFSVYFMKLNIFFGKIKITIYLYSFFFVFFCFVFYTQKKQFLETTGPVEARNLLKEVQGFIVEKPLEFLKDQNLYPPADSKEYVVPVKIFT